MTGSLSPWRRRLPLVAAAALFAAANLGVFLAYRRARRRGARPSRRAGTT